MADADTTTVSPEHEAAIGRVARSWAHLEYLIDLTIWDSAAVEQQFGACITAQIISANYKLSALIALARLRECGEQLLKDLDRFQAGLFPTLEKRNRMVHDPRFVRQQTGETVRWQTTAKPKEIHFGPKPETASDVLAVADEIAAQIRRFQGLRARILNEVGPLPGKQPIQLLRVVEWLDEE